MLTRISHCTLLVLAIALTASAQTAGAQSPAPQAADTGAYQPKFAGDPAHSEAEAAALGYMRTVVYAEKLYKRKRGHYAESLAALVGHGSFTRRMTKTDRGDYTVRFRGTAEGYTLQLLPAQYDAVHRSFFVNETGEIRGEENQPATASSEPVK